MAMQESPEEEQTNILPARARLETGADVAAFISSAIPLLLAIISEWLGRSKEPAPLES